MLDFSAADLIKIPSSAIIGYLGGALKRKLKRAQETVRASLMQRGYGVCRVTAPDSPALDGAVELLRKRIPANQLDDSYEIKRWLKEVELEMHEHRNRLLDYLIIACEHERVTGVFYGHYYHTTSKLFFASYIARRRDSAPDLGSPASGIFNWLRRELGPYGSLVDCKGFVFELDHPDGIIATTAEGHERYNRMRTMRARRKLFINALACRELHLRELDIPYYQPALSIDGIGYVSERQSLFLCDPRWRKGNVPASLSRTTATKIIDFVFNEVYFDSFEYNYQAAGVDEKTRGTYYARLDAVKSDLLSRTPNPVLLLP